MRADGNQLAWCSFGHQYVGSNKTGTDALHLLQGMGGVSFEMYICIVVVIETWLSECLWSFFLEANARDPSEVGVLPKS